MSLVSDTQKQLLVPVAFVFLALLFPVMAKGFSPFTAVAVPLKNYAERVMANQANLADQANLACHDCRDMADEDGR